MTTWKEKFKILGRRKPYTVIGISRKNCARCGEKSFASWGICALDNFHFPICIDCDIALNDLVLGFMRVGGKQQIINEYRKTFENL